MEDQGNSILILFIGMLVAVSTVLMFSNWALPDEIISLDDQIMQHCKDINKAGYMGYSAEAETPTSTNGTWQCI